MSAGRDLASVVRPHFCGPLGWPSPSVCKSVSPSTLLARYQTLRRSSAFDSALPLAFVPHCRPSFSFESSSSICSSSLIPHRPSSLLFSVFTQLCTVVIRFAFNCDAIAFLASVQLKPDRRKRKRSKRWPNGATQKTVTKSKGKRIDPKVNNPVRGKETGRKRNDPTEIS
jgi:hypothetical protein